MLFGNQSLDGKKWLSDAWALDTTQKPYGWQKLNLEGDKPSGRIILHIARMRLPVPACSNGMFLQCGGRDISDAYGLLMNMNGEWEWTLARGVSPSLGTSMPQ
ncbi:hypothetical protein CTI12_AA279600 [Artemisia annua]|uniref:Uncharacterized protein n=1 Tax=Artemisia annua TaxID=35608 RepID=A0A2U1LCX0_ARTAN|nr:hypothetical protein CTI12_AA408890 [Artemisia annua]PWA71407.1 hypothetical protein CTI12_AA279600 [Artemisia annua]